MSKSFTEKSFQPREYLKLQDWTKEQKSLVESANSISSEQLPIESINPTHVVDVESHLNALDTRPDGSTQVGSDGFTQATGGFYFVDSSSLPTNVQDWDRENEDIDGNITNSKLMYGPPQVTISTGNLAANNNGVWQDGVNSFSTYGALGTFLRVPARRGMLHIEALLDIELFISIFERIVEQTPAPGRWGLDASFELLLYQDDILIGSTDALPGCTRKTYRLQASYPCGEGDTDIDVRFKVKFGLDEVQGAGELAVLKPLEMNLYNAQLWVRNEAR